ncbi:MAG: hypothetical protein HYU54_03540 [Actinobacteria bacterium]|nr:hypothetical protein [Actinomycetota bacterium]
MIQIASGFFLFTATSEGPGLWHYVLPGLAVVAIFGARSTNGDGRIRAIGAASLFAAAASVFSYLTGLTHG